MNDGKYLLQFHNSTNITTVYRHIIFKIITKSPTEPPSVIINYTCQPIIQCSYSRHQCVINNLFKSNCNLFQSQIKKNSLYFANITKLASGHVINGKTFNKIQNKRRETNLRSMHKIIHSRYGCDDRFRHQLRFDNRIKSLQHQDT